MFFFIEETFLGCIFLLYLSESWWIFELFECYPCEQVWVSLNMLLTHLGASYRDVPRGKPIHLATSGLNVQCTHAGVGQFYFVPKITIYAGTEKAMSLSTAWLTLQPSSSFKFVQNPNEDCPDQPIDWIRLIRLSSPVKAKVVCCEYLDHSVFRPSTAQPLGSRP